MQIRHFAAVVLLSSIVLPEWRIEAQVVSQSRIEQGEFTAQLNGLKLWFRISGKGPICLMPTPAWGPSSDLWFRTLTALERQFTVVYLDSRGTGRSERARASTEYTWDQLVADLDALRVHLRQERVWLMGHSEGGAQVLHYAAQHPDRVNGLVLIDALAVADAEQDADAQTRLGRHKDQPWYHEAVKALEAEPTTEEEFAAGVKTMLPLYWSDPSKIQQFEADFNAGSLSVEAARGSTDSKRFPFDLRQALKGVTAPALVIVGQDDFICSPFAARRIHLSLPHSKLLVIEGSGHFPWPEATHDIQHGGSEISGGPRPLCALMATQGDGAGSPRVR